MDKRLDAVPSSGPATSNKSGASLGAGVAGAVVSGFLASACCIGPLLAVFLGVTSAGALVALEPYRPLFGALMLAFLGYGFYRAYGLPGRPRTREACCSQRSLRAQRVVLWFAAALAVAFFFGPNLLLSALG